MLSVNGVIVQTSVFILHICTCVLNVPTRAMACVAIHSVKGIWENSHAYHGAGAHTAQSFSTRQLSRGQSCRCEVWP